MAFGKRRREEQASLEEIEDEQIFSESVEEIQVQQQPPQEVEDTVVQPQPKNTNLKPLLDEVIFLGTNQAKNSSNKDWQCKYCKQRFSSTYTRIHQHFFGTKIGQKANIIRCTSLINDRAAFERVRRKVQLAEEKGVDTSLKNSTLFARQKPPHARPIEDAFKMMERDEVDLKVMRGLCANGISFNVLRNPQFHEMVSAINRGPQGYKAPNYEKARTTLLDETKRSIAKELEPIEATWYSQGVSIISDGWTNCKNEPLINVIAVNSRGAMFLYAENFAGVEKTGKAIAEFLLKAIEEVGPHNVIQVVTDNAANCKLAGKEIEKVHNHIFWSPCVVHTLNLIFKDFANSFDWLRDTYKRGKEIVKYFVNHSQVLAIFRTNSRLNLLKVAKTRFASHYILLKRLVDCREALATTVVMRAWKDWVKHGDERTRTMGTLIADTIGDDDFWIEVESIISITKPLYFLIKFCDGEGAKMGEIYEKMDSMLGEIKDTMIGNRHADCYSAMEKIILERWEKMNIPIHCLGFALTPRFYDPVYLSSPAPGDTARKAPNEDREVVLGVLEAFTKIAENERESKMLREQFARFHMRKGIYGMAATQTDAVTMDAIEWWSNYGSETPELAEVAKKILSQPITSSSAERNWSTYSFIHSVKRNRLNSARADKLVYIHSNIRLLSRFSESYKTGPYKKWDIDAEETNIDDSIVQLDEMRWEALDGEFVDKSNANNSEQVQQSNSDNSSPIITRVGASRAAPTNQSRRSTLHQTSISILLDAVQKEKKKC